MSERYEKSFQKITSLQKNIQDIHPLLRKSMPIAIVEDNQFFIYDVPPGEIQYVLIKQAPTPMPIPHGVRAAFPLECYDGKAACVVTGEIFDSLEGYVTIFHEFIHCQQWETCEQRLKLTLEIARKAQAEDNFMWELNHPFPYENQDFVSALSRLFTEPETTGWHRILDRRRELKQLLEPMDFEYMTWQEWKEGFARLIENKINHRLGLDENHNGRDLPYSRVSLYESGAINIQLLDRQDPTATLDLENLFHILLME